MDFGSLAYGIKDNAFNYLDFGIPGFWISTKFIHQNIIDAGH